MERINGKHSLEISPEDLRGLLTSYTDVLLDLGTGDGRFVLRMAHDQPSRLVIGLDACRENLHEASRRAPANALFLIANALDLPAELRELANTITINFPWGTLLTGLLQPESPLLATLSRLARPGATLAIRLNGGALAEVGWSLEAGGGQVRHTVRQAGFRFATPQLLTAADLRGEPTTWARRLAFGRDPRALLLSGHLTAHAGWQTTATCDIMETLVEHAPRTSAATPSRQTSATRG